MNRRGTRKYIDDLLAGRRPKPFNPDDFEAEQIRTAIELTAGRPGADAPRPEFLDGLKARLAAEMSGSAPVAGTTAAKAPSATRRQVIVGTTAAATAAVAAVSVDRLLLQPEAPPNPDGGEVVPTDGQWRQVAASADVADGAVYPFDLGSISGFVRRTQGRVEAVSGVCTHQGCKLWFDRPADQLRCPCHLTSFSPAGQVLTHALPAAPKPLPHFDIRERDGVIEVLAPPPSQPV
ncbi:Rieske 2Fe-2S domain-containing protein [Mycobacterium hackensackense]|jgi:nitrite reductase/ring-hydroxylating ferredoxin subunit|uniref:Rieske (2Fe-2S) protein n=1 Tax=Mycobacterium hackensackense TaxID=228909 RepID=UPI002265ED93|nr:Rieske 2Fe-2S domain-containing protein [Mycobacterium hackensackense]MCV7256290.1 Rieske 2Fe-2S domain-containing protein [Mycobacterium hackensackense]